MSSIISGYNYDIFISYRQKDNKHDGWVTDFVNNLKGELESTFKEEISVYFDINPHDGLLETHDVDASLKEKLKCLILIPIISRTYCDPRSFAWEHEFKAFLEMASRDQLGLKVKLPEGNVASRVLPVQIHDLDPDDKKCIEEALGGHLRGIEFIYKEPGVDRPLKPNDKQELNLGKTQYNNQISKVAHAIRDIISGLKNPAERPDESKSDVPVKTTKPQKNKLLYIVGTVILLALVIGGVLLTSLFKRTTTLERSIAVLPFINDSPNDSNKYFINGIMVEILNNLQKIKHLSVVSITTSDQNDEKTERSISESARKLDVNYIVVGSGQKYGDRFILRVQLLEGRKGKQLWGNSYERQIRQTSDIIDIQIDIAKAIAAELRVTLTPEEKTQIEKVPTKNLTALDFYQQGKSEEINFTTEDADNPSLKRAELLYRKALAQDSFFAAAYAGLATVNLYEHYNSEYYTQNFLDSFLIFINKSLSIDPKLADGYYLKGVYYTLLGDPESALRELDNCLKYNPNYWQAYHWKADWIYGVNSKEGDYIQAIANLEKAIRLNHGKELSGLLRSVGGIFHAAGFPELTIKYYQDALSIDNDSISYYSSLTGLFNFTEYGKAEKYNVEWLSLDPENFNAIENIGDLRVLQGDFKTALKYHIKCAEWIRNTNQLGAGYMHRIGYTYWLNGNKDEAYFWFRKQKKFNLTTIERNRYAAAIAPTSFYDLACVYAFEGKKDSAYLNLQKLEEMKVFPLWWISLIKRDPLLDSLRKDREFRDLVNSLESKYQTEHERVRKWLVENKKL